MFDIGFFELCVIGVVALLVLGPERLPRAARQAGLWVGRAKRMITQVKRDIDNEIRQEEMSSLKDLKEAKESLSKTRESMSSFKEDLNQQVKTDNLDPAGKGSTHTSGARDNPKPKTGSGGGNESA